jgi:predicted ATP-binding protein involved in virulence
MRIDRLIIKNFNGFESCEIGFDTRFNLLVGDNASGKSSVLNAISILLDSWVLGIKGDEKGGAIGQDEVRLAAHKFGDEFSFEKQFPSRIEATVTVMGNTLPWARELSSEQGRTTNVEARAVNRCAEDAARRVREGAALTLPLICSYGTERLWFETRHRHLRKPKQSSTSLPSRFDGYKDCNLFEIQETELLDWLRAQFLEGLIAKKETLAIRSINRAFTGSIEGATGLVYSELYKDAIVEMESQEPQFFKNLSDGQRILLTLIGDLVRRTVTLNPHLGDDALSETPGVILVDELDLHLHPNWQRRIIHDLKRTFPLVQFIATTHSPQMIGEALPTEIRILSGGKAYRTEHSLGLDSGRVLEEIQGASRRSSEAEALIHKIAVAIEEDRLEEAKNLIADIEKMVGPEDAEVTRPRSLMKFMEAPQ